jgi:hypothetical protein
MGALYGLGRHSQRPLETSTYPIANTPLPMIEPIQWTCGWIVHANIKRPIVTRGAPAIAVELD